MNGRPRRAQRQSKVGERHGTNCTLKDSSKLCNQELKAWSKSISRLSVAIENTNKTLADLDELENQRPLTLPKNNFRKIIKNHLLRLLDYQK